MRQFHPYRGRGEPSALFNGSDTFGVSVKILQGSSKIELGITPAGDDAVVPDVPDASNEAGWSRRTKTASISIVATYMVEIGRQVA